MGEYFSERFEALMALPGIIATNPGLFLIILLIFGPLIYWKWRVIGKSTTRAMSDLTHGVRTDADSDTRPHELGIGTQDVLVMSPSKTPGMIWFALLFFGGGAVFFFTLVLPEEPTSENWWTFAGMAAFTIAAMIIIETRQTRIVVDEEGLERRRILHRRERVRFRDVVKTDLNLKAAAPVLKISTREGQSMRIAANYSGFTTLVQRLSRQDPSLKLHAAVLGRARNA